MTELTYRSLLRTQQPNKYERHWYTLYRSMQTDPEFKHGLRAWVQFPNETEASLWREEGSLMRSKGSFEDQALFTGLSAWLQAIELDLIKQSNEEQSNAE